MIVLFPTGITEVEMVATPLDTVAVPNTVAPFVKLTVPVTEFGRVAVIVTEVPITLGPEVVTDTVGLALLTT